MVKIFPRLSNSTTAPATTTGGGGSPLRITSPPNSTAGGGGASSSSSPLHQVTLLIYLLTHYHSSLSQENVIWWWYCANQTIKIVFLHFINHLIVANNSRAQFYSNYSLTSQSQSCNPDSLELNSAVSKKWTSMINIDFCHYPVYFKPCNREMCVFSDEFRHWELCHFVSQTACSPSHIWPVQDLPWALCYRYATEAWKSSWWVFTHFLPLRLSVQGCLLGIQKLIQAPVAAA